MIHPRSRVPRSYGLNRSLKIPFHLIFRLRYTLSFVVLRVQYFNNSPPIASSQCRSDHLWCAAHACWNYGKWVKSWEENVFIHWCFTYSQYSSTAVFVSLCSLWYLMYASELLCSGSKHFGVFHQLSENGSLLKNDLFTYRIECTSILYLVVQELG